MYAVKQNPVLKLMGANFYRTEDMQTMFYLSQYRTKVFKLYYKSLVLNCARLIEITHSTIILLRAYYTDFAIGKYFRLKIHRCPLDVY